MASSRFQLISQKFVKPSFPTPSSLRNYKLSFIDQIMTNRYIPMALFFPNQHKNLPDKSSHQISSLLEKSLSKTLASYYPFSGRFTDKISVNCNDMGATFLEARIKCSMSEILKEANAKVEDIVFPSGLPWSPGHDQPSLVVAQLSHFDCGGKALSVCLSHKLGDGHTLCNFINDWAAMARHQSSDNPSPQFIGASILPPIDDPSICSLLDLKQGQRCVTWRYTFEHDKLSQLKAKAAEFGVQKPTRVEVVSALLYKSAMAASMECSGSFKPSLLSSMLNLRPLIGPPVTENYTGNFFSFFPVLTTHEKEMNFSRLVSEIRREKIQHYEKYKATKTNEFLSATLEKAEQLEELQGTNDIDEYGCTSLCRFPTYHIDFGWGRPIRVSLATCPYESYFALMDNHNLDGIEALVTLQEEVMPVFQSDPELLAFASPGSSF